MQIPYEVQSRPDTGLYNAKLGIWLFLASEVMLFGGLFSAYIFQRIGAEPGYWPHGLLNVPVGMFNTIVLIASSVTVVLAWAALKMRRYTQYWWCMLFTIVCGVAFLCIKLAVEWPQKFHHFGVFIKKDAIGKYEDYLGNEHLKEHNLAPRYEISGHLEAVEVERGGQHQTIEVHSPSHAEKELAVPGTKLLAFEMNLDEVNAEPKSEKNERPSFWPRPITEEKATIHAEDIENVGDGKWASAFLPRHSTYFGTYFLITGLHGLHVLGGIIVFGYFFLFGKPLYLRNPEHMANRVEVAGLFWHFVDLVWIFVFPIFYLL